MLNTLLWTCIHVRTYFIELSWKKEETEENNDEEADDRESQEVMSTYEEYTDMIKKLKSEKAVERDEISNWIINDGSGELQKKINKPNNENLKGKVMLTIRKDTLLTSIYIKREIHLFATTASESFISTPRT